MSRDYTWKYGYFITHRGREIKSRAKTDRSSATQVVRNSNADDATQSDDHGLKTRSQSYTKTTSLCNQQFRIYSKFERSVGTSILHSCLVNAIQPWSSRFAHWQTLIFFLDGFKLSNGPSRTPMIEMHF